ncbi:MAG: signal recognition particle protein [Chloroflexota bacterium]|nr:signal recognition particle protein [Chloroflexota bacterium]
MFESLSTKLQAVFKELSRHGKLRPEDIDSALREIRLALLEADVHYQVVKDLLERVKERALGEDVSRSLNPAQQVIRIIHQELVAVLGVPERLRLQGAKPRVILLVGLQGSGKTTTAAKLARQLKGQGERTMLIAADPYRPAAVTQLEVLGAEIDIPVFTSTDRNPAKICIDGFEKARKGGVSVVVIDTAGRLQIDEPMMEELRTIRAAVDPTETLLIVDAMTGQEAVQIAQGFNAAVDLTGLILTKMDGDARGGAAISMRAVTGMPIKFIGVGEARDALETFDPERLASRILGMGDVLSIIEKAEAAIEKEAVEAQAERLMQGEFTLDDFAQQLAMMRQMGPVSKLLEALPAGVTGNQIDSQDAENQLVFTQAILQSMTAQEKRKPEILNASRKRRIARGSGTSVQQINQLLRQHRQMRKMMKQIGKRGLPRMGSWPL